MLHTKALSLRSRSDIKLTAYPEFFRAIVAYSSLSLAAAHNPPRSAYGGIHIPKTLADELREYVGGIYGLEKESRIFNVSKCGLHREIDRAVKSCGLPDICVHGLRHSCASFLQSEELKIPEVVVSAILGHSNTKSMTGRYSHAYEKDLIIIRIEFNSNKTTIQPICSNCC